MPPAISVIVPVYNVEGYLGRCLDSILGQSFRDFELILVDDGSTDGSPALCDEYRRRDSRVRVIHRENAGVGLARNSGLEIARGEYIAFADADDYLGDSLLNDLYMVAVRHNVDCVIGGTSIVYARGGIGSVPVVDCLTLWEGEQIEEYVLCSVSAPPAGKRDTIYGQTSCGRLYRRKLIVDHHLRFFSEREYISEDTLFNIDFCRHASRVAAIPGALYYYDCGHIGSLSKGYRADRFEKALIFTQALEKHLETMIPKERYCLYTQRFLIMLTAYIITQEVLYHDHVDPAHPMGANIRRILGDGTLRQTLREYPWHRLPLLRMILAVTMRLRLTGLLILLIRIQQRVMKSCQNI